MQSAPPPLSLSLISGVNEVPTATFGSVYRATRFARRRRASSSVSRSLTLSLFLVRAREQLNSKISSRDARPACCRRRNPRNQSADRWQPAACSRSSAERGGIFVPFSRQMGIEEGVCKGNVRESVDSRSSRRAKAARATKSRGANESATCIFVAHFPAAAGEAHRR